MTVRVMGRLREALDEVRSPAEVIAMKVFDWMPQRAATAEAERVLAALVDAGWSLVRLDECEMVAEDTEWDYGTNEVWPVYRTVTDDTGAYGHRWTVARLADHGEYVGVEGENP